MTLFKYIREHLSEFQGTPNHYTKPEELRVGDVVGDGRPSYVVQEAPEVHADGTVSAMVQFIPDGGFGERIWDRTDEAIVPVISVVPGSPADEEGE